MQAVGAFRKVLLSQQRRNHSDDDDQRQRACKAKLRKAKLRKRETINSDYKWICIWHHVYPQLQKTTFLLHPTWILEKSKMQQPLPANLDAKVPTDGPRLGVRRVSLPKHHSTCLHNIQSLPDLQGQKKIRLRKKINLSRKSENY